MNNMHLQSRLSVVLSDLGAFFTEPESSHIETHIYFCKNSFVQQLKYKWVIDNALGEKNTEKANKS